MTLNVVNANLAQRIQARLSTHEFGNSLLSHNVTDIVNGLHHDPIDRVFCQIFNETPVDFDNVDREMLEVSKGGHPRPKVIQREQAAH